MWARGRSGEMNLTLGFYGTFDRSYREEAVLYLTGASVYRVFVNGAFLCHGPARAAHGHSRVDVIRLPEKLLEERNSLAIEVAGYCVGSFYLLDEPSFLQAELRLNGKTVLATGAEKGFRACVRTERIQKVQRYSFQRVFLEAYRMEEGCDGWRRQGFGTGGEVELMELPPAGGPRKLLKRHVPYCAYPLLLPEGIVRTGEFYRDTQAKRWEDRSFLGISESYKGYPVEELSLRVSEELDQLVTCPDSGDKAAGVSAVRSAGDEDGTQCPAKKRETGWPREGIVLEQGQFVLAGWKYNATGFLGAEVECSQDSVLVYVFDEVLTETGDLSYNRMCCVNAVWYELKKGCYHLETMEPYTQKYGKWMVLSGSVRIRHMWVREYANPAAAGGEFFCDNPVVNEIFEAGRRTFGQNAVDLYMDCPSRERAGWLCDSFFTARVEAALTGDTRVEDNFLENYALSPQSPDLPGGMLPMCYPADHTTGEFIPNWPLWLILELLEYRERKPKETVTAAMYARVEALFSYFKAFENEDGLLEDLEGWIFVEWSRANELTEGVNYPSNMLYSAALQAAGRIYNRKDWQEKGERLAEVIREQSFQGGFFADQAVRENGRLKLRQESTEVCQYYAFTLGIADRESYPELFEILRKDFGPVREQTGKYPEIAFANAFIGNYLRIEMLSRYGCADQILAETEAFFGYMAERTGTLWENTGAYASCDHGFASHICWVCYRDLLGVRRINRREKRVELCVASSRLACCSGVIPVEEERLTVAWRRERGEVILEYRAPAGYEVVIYDCESAQQSAVNLL